MYSQAALFMVLVEHLNLWWKDAPCLPFFILPQSCSDWTRSWHLRFSNCRVRVIENAACGSSLGASCNKPMLQLSSQMVGGAGRWRCGWGLGFLWKEVNKAKSRLHFKGNECAVPPSRLVFKICLILVSIEFSLCRFCLFQGFPFPTHRSKWNLQDIKIPMKISLHEIRQNWAGWLNIQALNSWNSEMPSSTLDMTSCPCFRIIALCELKRSVGGALCGMSEWQCPSAGSCGTLGKSLTLSLSLHI